jgi:hypothetical protein
MVMTLELWKEKLEKVHGPGELMHGSDMSSERAKEWARERFSDRDYCIVRGWVWVDFSVLDDMASKVLQDQLQPAMVRANYVVYDSAGRFDEGNWVHTSPLRTFSDGFIFETRNTVYLLLGIGYRKTARNTL